MQEPKRVIIWDFDGVIADSLKECFILTQRTLSALETDYRAVLLGKFSPLSYAEFKRTRRHAIMAADFFACYLIERLYLRFSQSAYDEVTRKHKKLLHSSDAEYYNQREKLSTRQLSKSMRLYPRMLEVFSSLNKMGYSHVIMSARDSKSIRQWLSHYGALRYFKLIVGNEVSRGDRNVKHKQISLIRHKFPTARLFFVDDMLFNLLLVSRFGGISSIFAGWGYGKIGKAQKRVFVARTPASLVKFFREEQTNAQH